MSKVAAFFDADETLIKGSSAYHLARELYRRDFFGMRDIVFAAWHSFLYVTLGEDNDRIKRVTDRAVGVMAGHSVAELRAIGDEVYESMLGARVFAGTRKILKRHLAHGAEVWLISATPDMVAQLIAERIGATGGIGTKIAIKDGILQPKLLGPMMHGKAKADEIRRLAKDRDIDLDRSWAYSDSWNDLPMLLLVGNPVVVNPDPRLRLYAKQHGWKIHDFRARRRRDMRKTARRSAQLAGVAWFLTRLIRGAKDR